MNIQEAKEQIQNTVKAYLSKNDLGMYDIPVEKQRPIFLMGPPGIGKTAIMAQVASELGIAMIPYSMTHHTRQSALGLPFIVHKNYEGKEYDVSEYTMSEIIASIYDLMENTGIKNGILFLDEINCVSETLSPVMLQFLQYKVFGRHQVPEGWVVVTAGNPPEYNNSVHEFDIVTWDRLKRIDVEPDFDAWKEYAYSIQVHPAVTTFLETKKDCFYKIESTVDGKSFVTARGWDDLSQMIQLYEKLDIPVDLKLISQYVQNRKIARDFAVYYDLFNKYKSDYQVGSILKGKADKKILERASQAKFDERYALLGLMLDGIREEVQSVMTSKAIYAGFFEVLKQMKIQCAKSGFNTEKFWENSIQNLSKDLEKGKASGSYSPAKQAEVLGLIRYMEKLEPEIKDLDGAKAFDLLRKKYADNNKQLKKDVKACQKVLANAFKFCEDAFGNGQEILILVTELTIDPISTSFISQFGSKEYFDHNKDLLFYERENEIDQALAQLDNLDELE